MPSSPRREEIIIAPDRAALARRAAERFVQWARGAISAHGEFDVALSGGSTPRDLYALLASPEFAGAIDWTRVQFFWGDERAVPPNDPASNFRMANEALFARVPVPRENIHRMPGEKEPAAAAREYEQTLRQLLPSISLKRGGQSVAAPRFDLVLLGLGENGHTASLFPHTSVLHNTRDWVASEYIPAVKMDRITLTVPAINAAAEILFLVAGSQKAATVRAVLRGVYSSDELPAQLIRPEHGSLVWMLDQAAAAQLDLDS